MPKHITIENAEEVRDLVGLGAEEQAVEEAPTDNKAYNRKNGDWEEAASGGGADPAGVNGDLQVKDGDNLATIGGLTLNTTGNARGMTALDIQSDRSAATQVAGAEGSVTLGLLNTATGGGGYSPGSIAIGYNNTANGYHCSLAVGALNAATGDGNDPAVVAFGYGNNVDNTGTAVGRHNTAQGIAAVSLGSLNTANGYFRSTAIGSSNQSTSDYSITVGRNNQASASGSIAIGSHVNNSVANSLQIGPSNTEKLSISSAGVNFITGGAGTFSVNGTPVGGGGGADPAGSDGAIQINDDGSFATIDGLTLDTTGNARGTDSLDLQSKRSSATQVASADESVAFGIRNTASSYSFYMDLYRAISVGVDNTAHAQEGRSVAVGISNNSGNEGGTVHFGTVALGISNEAKNASTVAVGLDNSVPYSFGADYGYSCAMGVSNTTNGNYCASVGYDNEASQFFVGFSSAVGVRNKTLGDGCSAFGSNTTAGGDYGCSAFGYFAKTTTDNTVEIGQWSGINTRDAAVRLHNTGMVAITLENRSAVYGDGLGTAGAEDHGTIMRESYAIRRDGDDIYIDVNIGGTVKTLQLGEVSS